MKRTDRSQRNRSHDAVPHRAVTDAPPVLSRLRKVSFLLDRAIALPGSDIRVGLDPILGLLPGGGGDTLTGVISIYIVVEAIRLGLPAATLGRMGANILLDLAIGVVPLLGDLFDVAWKSNTQNVALIEKHLANPTPAKAADRVFAILMLVVLIALVVGMTLFSIWLVGQIFQGLRYLFSQ